MNSIKSTLLKRRSALFLKIVLWCIRLTTIAGMFFILKVLFNNDLSGVYWPILLSVLIILFPFLFSLFQADRLLVNIDNNEAFSKTSIVALERIRLSAFVICSLFIGVMPFIYYVGEVDAPVLILLGCIITATPSIVAVFASVLVKLIKSGLEMKSENELTI